MGLNFNTQDVHGVQDTTNPRKWKFVRPTTLNWNDFVFDFRPIAGQDIRIRESIEIYFTLIEGKTGSMIWENRFLNEAFIGHFQVTRLNASGGDTGTVTERGQIIGTSQNTSVFKWVFQREYSLNLFLKLTDKNAASLSAISNCNADLAPGAVANRNIDSSNVDTYVRIVYAIATGDLPNAATLIDSLKQPVIAGYKFPDSVLFRAKNQISSVDLTGYQFSTRLGDIALWVHPDWIVQPDADYGAQVIDFSLLDTTTEQFPDGTVCTYPGPGAVFP